MPHHSQDPHDVAERLRAALDLMEAGIEMMRQRIRRENPELTPEEVADRMGRWLQDRPADAPGRHVRWPRRTS